MCEAMLFLHSRFCYRWRFDRSRRRPTLTAAAASDGSVQICIQNLYIVFKMKT